MLNKYVKIKIKVSPNTQNQQLQKLNQHNLSLSQPSDSNEPNELKTLRGLDFFRKKKNAFFIEGGGTRGVYAMGVMKYLFDDNQYIQLQDVDLFGGTSVGSFLATALSLGYQKADIEKYVAELDLSKFIDSKYLAPITAYRFLTKGHLYDDTGRQNIVKNVLNLRIDDIKKDLGISPDSDFTGIDITFGHLKKLIENHPKKYKHLLINTVDISKEEQVFMTTLNDSWDDITLFDGILASSAVPFVFIPTTLYYNTQTKKYQYNETKDTTKDSFVDGGVINNSPLDYLLLNSDMFSNYNLWMLQFTCVPDYTKVTGVVSMIPKMIDMAFGGGRKNIGLELIQEKYEINVINLKLSAFTFAIYNNAQIQTITKQMYEQCSSGILHFEGK